MAQGNEIVNALRLMCDKDDTQDKKLLLLAELVSVKFEKFSEVQESLLDKINNVNGKMDKLSELLEKYESDTHNCPVYKNRSSFEGISFFIKYPKVTLILLIGTIALLFGVVGTDLINSLKIILGI